MIRTLAVAVFVALMAAAAAAQYKPAVEGLPAPQTLNGDFSNEMKVEIYPNVGGIAAQTLDGEFSTEMEVDSYDSAEGTPAVVLSPTKYGARGEQPDPGVRPDGGGNGIIGGFAGGLVGRAVGAGFAGWVGGHASSMNLPSHSAPDRSGRSGPERAGGAEGGGHQGGNAHADHEAGDHHR